MKTRKKKTQSPGNREIRAQLEKIGAQIRKARTSRGLSVAELSEKSGIAVPQIYMIERGSNCTLKTLLKVRDALRIKITI